MTSRCCLPRPLPVLKEQERIGKGLIAACALLLVALLTASAVARAQDKAVTDNDVIRVAERMYCPVCENIPLDECQTTACLEWKEEIRRQLAAGRGAQEVIDSFVARFGDHVVGLPQDPLLRTLAIVTPLLASVVALGVGLVTFRRFSLRKALSLHDEGSGGQLSDDEYRRRLEEDVLARR